MPGGSLACRLVPALVTLGLDLRERLPGVGDPLSAGALDPVGAAAEDSGLDFRDGGGVGGAHGGLRFCRLGDVVGGGGGHVII